MECLLFGGAPSVGKSETIYRLTQRLVQNNNFEVVTGNIPTTFKDFRVVLGGFNSTGKKVRIIINSATDTVQIIKDFKEFYNANGSYDILISSVRDGDNWPRGDFFSIMDLANVSNTILEIPLGKVTRRQPRFNASLDWYQRNNDRLVTHLLSLPLYNL